MPRACGLVSFCLIPPSLTQKHSPLSLSKYKTMICIFSTALPKRLVHEPSSSYYSSSNFGAGSYSFLGIISAKTLKQINAKLLCLPFVFFLAFLLFQYRAHSSSRALIAFLCVRCRNFSLFLGPLGQNRNKTRRSRSERRKEIRRNGTRKERHFARRDRDIRAVNFLGRPRGAD